MNKQKNTRNIISRNTICIPVTVLPLRNYFFFSNGWNECQQVQSWIL